MCEISNEDTTKNIIDLLKRKIDYYIEEYVKPWNKTVQERAEQTEPVVYFRIPLTVGYIYKHINIVQTYYILFNWHLESKENEETYKKLKYVANCWGNYLDDKSCTVFYSYINDENNHLFFMRTFGDFAGL